MAIEQLSSSQAQALFDILTHHEAYAEIQALKKPQAIASFGAPLQPERPSASSSSPLIQTLLDKFIYNLPGIRDVSQDFWTRNISGLVSALADANLSESYDKGSIGIRKTLSTAIASVVEYVSRGTLGGFPKTPLQNADRRYDASNPDDVTTAWDDFLQQIIYGDMLDRMFAKAAQTDQLSDHESIVQAVHEYVFVMSNLIATRMGSFLHYILIISPRGQSMLPLLNRANNMLPYFLIRQTLKVGNAASMLSGMMKLILAKMNLSTVTTWFGGATSDSGMNLLQQIISTVLGWDVSALEKRAVAVEKDQASPSKELLETLRTYCARGLDEQQVYRTRSEAESISLVIIILDDSSKSTDLSDEQHALALDYIAIRLAIRDRQELINILCHHQPDLLTSSVREAVSAYEPIIRALHKAVDLSGGVSDLQAFLTDLIGISKVDDNSKQSNLPTVEDYCRLLKKHQGSSHRFIHQVLKNGKNLTEWYHDYAFHATAQYRQKLSPRDTSDTLSGTAAGDFTSHLEGLVATLPAQEKSVVLDEINKHADFLSSLTLGSTTSMKTAISNLSAGKSEMTHGPGIYLYKWQALMDETPITPATAHGPVRNGKSESVRDATGVDTDGVKKGGKAGPNRGTDQAVLTAPDVSHVVRLLVPMFRQVLATINDN
ncbi:hypothetical protein MMC28_004050 [Mycoblastus sanguinarius]|nr:hypothetical protein [Mycoblastus sanguinarius]